MLAKIRGHADLNHGPLDLQSNALPLSYTPDELLQCETDRTAHSIPFIKGRLDMDTYKFLMHRDINDARKN